jgi:hypothetical protein
MKTEVGREQRKENNGCKEFSRVAQLAEQDAVNVFVGGSSPSPGARSKNETQT